MSDNQPIDDWIATARAAGIAQAKILKEQAGKGGLRFEAYLPSGLAEWLLDLVERGVFLDQSEAVFVILGEYKNLEMHPDLRQELLKRVLEAAVNDPRPPISFEEFKERFDELRAEPPQAPAIWHRQTEKSFETFEATSAMQHTDFHIGLEFLTASGRWRVTDIGTRTIIAIKLDESNPRNYNGPPYSIAETVFDEYDFGGCKPVETLV